MNGDKVPPWVVDAINTARSVRKDLDNVDKALKEWERALENKKEAALRGLDYYEGQTILYTNSDHDQFDKFVKTLTKSHRSIAKKLDYRSAHDLIDILNRAEEKMWDGSGYI